jgi:probable F420-dependent oxidoreductase
VKFGVCIFVTDRTVAPGDLGRLVEDRGFDALFVTEHTHIPRNTVREVDDRYRRSLDPFVVLTAAAAATTRLRLGTGVLLIAQRDPITTAKEIASLDHVSGGRVDIAVGAGWNKPEIENHGTPFGRRFGVMRERVEAMKAIWTQDEASYHGRHVHFDAMASWPKPVQRPHPPVLIGGNRAKVLDRVLRYGDGWFPNSADGLSERIAELRARGAEAGRDHIPVTYFGAPAKLSVVERLAQAGVDRVLFMLPSAARDEVERVADEAAAVAADAAARLS